jgi:hypothetical protein
MGFFRENAGVFLLTFIIILLFLFSLKALLFPKYPTTYLTLFSNQSEREIFRTGWDVILNNATGWENTISDDKLIVTDIYPSSQNMQGDGFSAIVTTSRSFDPFGDFYITFNISWDSEDSRTGLQNPNAVQGLIIRLYGNDDRQIASAGYEDLWIDSTGRKTAIVGDEKFDQSQNSLDFSGSAKINISRYANEVFVTWDDEELISGTDDKPLIRIDIQFCHYLYNISDKQSFFGTQTVDKFLLTNSPLISTTTISIIGE